MADSAEERGMRPGIVRYTVYADHDADASMNGRWVRYDDHLAAARPKDEVHCGCVPALRKEVDRLKAENERLREALQAYVLSQSRMLDRWAEGDIDVKARLWADLHLCEDAGRAALAPATPAGEESEGGKG